MMMVGEYSIGVNKITVTLTFSGKDVHWRQNGRLFPFTVIRQIDTGTSMSDNFDRCEQTDATHIDSTMILPIGVSWIFCLVLRVRAVPLESSKPTSSLISCEAEEMG